MMGVGLALAVVGVIFLFVVPWIGIPVALAGLVVSALSLAGLGRGEEPTGRSL